MGGKVIRIGDHQTAEGKTWGVWGEVGLIGNEKLKSFRMKKMNSLILQGVEPPGGSSREINLNSIIWNFVLIIKATLRWNDAFRRQQTPH